MARTTTTFKPATQPALLTLLVRLVESGAPATAADLNTTSIYMGRLAKDGLVKVADQVRSGQRGRPAHIYRATDKGRKRARRAGAVVTA